MKNDEINIFTFLNQLFYKRKDHEYDKKIANSFYLLLWLSHDDSLIEILNDINMFMYNIPDEKVYEYLYYKIPKGKRFIKYIKKSKEDKEKNKKIQELMDKYEISEKEANLFNNLL